MFYHYVRDVERTPFPGIKALSVAGFDAQLDWLQARFDVIDGPTFERAVLVGRGLRPADGAADVRRRVCRSLRARVSDAPRDRGLGGIFFLAGATLGENPVLLNVHKTHFLLSQLGADRFTDGSRRRARSARASTLGRQRRSVLRTRRIYRYDEAPDVRIKRILNYEAPYPVADRVLSKLFARHLGDSGGLRARSLSLRRPGSRDGAGRHDVRLSYRNATRCCRGSTRDAQRAELRNGPVSSRTLTGQHTVSLLLSRTASRTRTTPTRCACSRSADIRWPSTPCAARR